MGAAQLLLGALAVALMLGMLTLAASRLQRTILPGASPALRALMVIVLVTAGIVLDAQLAGLADQLRRWPLVLGAAVLAGLQEGATRRFVSRDAAPAACLAPTPSSLPGSVRVLAWLPVVVAVAQWTTSIAVTLRRGFTDDDSIAYHLPLAARFAQLHSTRELQFVAIEQPITFYPLNTELLHGSLISLMGSDLLSPFVNLGLLAVFVLVAWCVGEPSGHQHACVAVAGLLLASRLFTSHLAGTALVDLFGITFFCAAAVLVLRADRRLSVVAIGGLGGGLALGSKFPMIAPVGLLTIVVIVVSARRWRAGAVWLAALSTTGGFWYVRNWMQVGNPLPPLGLRLGPVGFDETSFAISEFSHSVASYLTDATAVREVFVPGLRSDFGTLWAVLVLLVAVGVVGSVLLGPSRPHRLVGLVAGGSLLAYLLTPGGALSFGSLPDLVYFSSAVRYGGPAIALGLLLLPTIPRFADRKAQVGIVAVVLVVLIGNQLVSAPLWWSWLPGASKAPGIAVGLALLVVGGALSQCEGERRRRLLVAGVVVAVLSVVPALLFVNDQWAHRYRSVATDLDRLDSWAQPISHANIGTAGFFRLYPLYGRDLTNHVQPVGQVGPRGEFGEATSCGAWVRALADGDYDYVVTAPSNASIPPPRQEAWTASMASATVVFRSGGVTVFRVGDGPADGCGAGQ